ncbi:MAG: hypothetical protein COZ49_04045 [Candidatus Yonathbacteria bacterium CG_4_10_14_3_um_filter_47_65]|uniref:UDP-N-acetylmuramoyl-L-alanyl-D-glutamate--2, 6-diaminopimelate ligase n=2 Tax=Parcubacteria group TaxID=1794811 RepID=A0A2M8D5L0_9BACT|nr:MAG: hypothetical protein AUJ44_01445 [Candidatus Nomurabacteria bacterium CG1_02_47_685]PIP03411.1 MAG: hypothetical protein COX54_03715 [Candidatus Yonathbacteria bacterium CG23_combo_of_CG06-09_8_20_14_all_46_18]PIQ32262.1 MAG: hypothetical protein COW61_01885 [Candidatus Yonathbacteria bacterium CG17_big_fil_post_rev_8_21_14_2_50_46_19]PIX56061.1 MAG: hypothetical protein COZ49_04045 [Candidatus Yonathbacteria bacterium CG_4_10_14_3_um_filter_47_65]PIY57571.1 MAG: hypothetical protein CO
MFEKLARFMRRIIPAKIFGPSYHFTLAGAGAFRYGFPSRKIFLLGVTGTKGKTSTVELVNAILEKAGYKTAIAGTLRIKIGDVSERNLFKMTMPGRMFLQGFLRRAIDAGCQYAIIEMTSEGVRQFRHRFLDLDALIFTNISPEHIESHGSYEKYLVAKLSLARSLTSSKKKYTWMIANGDDKEAKKFCEVADKSECISYSLHDAHKRKVTPAQTTFTLDGVTITSRLLGEFNLYNMLAAASFAKTQGIPIETVKTALEGVAMIRGRFEAVEEGQNFRVIVDYAHTPDSLEKAYGALGDTRKICVLGGTGGGRDAWKRAVMGKIADRECSHIILTNEDPYDEDPYHIVNMIAEGIAKTPFDIVMDRREAIARALQLADKDSTIIITGKGTDPYIMGPNGSKTPWDDASVVREELAHMMTNESEQRPTKKKGVYTRGISKKKLQKPTRK